MPAFPTPLKPAETRRDNPFLAASAPPRRPALTLVELLVVVSIISVLIGLLIPAVQMARESSRRTACANNLRQLGVAAKLHADAQGFFPTGGWGPEWVGDPDAGFGPKQPGGWLYNVLPYLEQQSLRNEGKGLRGDAKEAALARALQTSLSLVHCPSRREPVLYPYKGPSALKNCTPPSHVAKNDYAINTLISSQKSEVIVAEIQLRNGLSATPLAGEKAVSAEHYADGQAEGDKLALFVGDCPDVGRAAAGIAAPDANSGAGYGAAHASVCQFVFADGSVHAIAFDEEISLLK